ncbi:MAG: fused MFS/spermidine synthase [Candidatus Eisenbacteria bacterium]
MRPKQRTYVFPVLALFLFSGATSLAYEVVWTRLLVRSFGATSFAVSTVLAAFMAGLALGSYLFGRLIDKRGNPILVYGLLELGIGAFALVFPFLLGALTPIYRSIYPGLHEKFYLISLIRFLLSFSMLLIPATLMGGTLPVLSRYVTRSLKNLTFRVGWLYSINTFGAVAGTFGTGFLLLPALGMKMTTYVAVAANLAIFVVSLMLAKTAKRAPGMGAQAAREESAPKPARAHGYEKVVLGAFLFTGLAALSAEVIWTRVLTLVVGTTVYAFATMLTTFLLGLAVGSAVFARVAQRTSRPRTLFALLVLVIGFLVFATTVAFGKLPAVYMDLYQSIGKTWQSLMSVQFMLSLSLMILPTFFMGGTFPLVARIYATDLTRVGARIGTAYAFNTIGSILGSFIGSFLLLRLLGVEKGMIAVSVIYLAVGLVLFLTVAEKVKMKWRTVGVAVVGVGIVLLMVFSPGWDRKLMTSAVYVYAPLYQTTEGLNDALKVRHMLFYDEGPGATVSVERNQNIIAIRIDGKIDASSGNDMITQELISHLPLFFHPQPDTVLMIGLGSGVSLGSAETHEIKYIECVELLENVIEAAHFFDTLTRNTLSDPRLKMIVGDGRNHVRLSERSYDVIISQPTNPWISGVGDLFTVEFFTEARKRLKPGGIMCAWFQIYHMGGPELRSTLKTFASVFPHATLWFSNEADVILIGSLEPVRIDEHLLERMMAPGTREDLDRVSIDDVGDLLGALLLSDAGLRAFVDEGDRIHTDDNMLLEFQSGRRIVESTHVIHLPRFLEALKPYRYDGLDDETNKMIADRVRARKLTLKGTLERLDGRVDRAVGLYDAAYAAAPGDQYVVSKYAEIHGRFGDAALVSGDLERAGAEYEKALVGHRLSDAWVAYDGLGFVHQSKGEYAEARENYRASVALNPYHADGLANLAWVEIELGDTVAAVAEYEKAIELVPDDVDAANNLAWLYATGGFNLDRALELAELATSRARDASYFDTLGWVHFKRGELDLAQASLERALCIERDRVESKYHLAHVHLGKGERDRAGELLHEVIELDRGGTFAAKAGVMLDEIGNK